MPNQVTGKSATTEQARVLGVEMGLPSSTSPSDLLLRRIAILLFVLVSGLLTVFGYYASSICITVVLAGFLAILFDPVVVTLEKLHLPRGVAAAGIVLAGMSLIGLLGYALYGRAMSFAEELPVYASKVQQTVEPNQPEDPRATAECWEPCERRASYEESARGSGTGIANLA
jgi:predicted PurR-regulated permease PerM